ncbi:MAG TPA: glycosyltransferase family 2 protein [Acidobacteriota bacterium]|nr:glycosyltransferase family 2 protein [Acidobacteriota bacterium]
MASITVIIPTWNRGDLLRNCLESLRRQTVSASVLVVDNGSVDSTPAIMADCFPEFQYLRLESNHGFAKAINRGIERTGTEFIALLNNDTEADPGWIENGLKAFRQCSQCGIVASKMLNYWHRDRLDSAGDRYLRSGLPLKRGSGERSSSYEKLEPVMGASAGAAFYRRRLFDQVGFFDETYYMYLEDVDLSLRARLAGFECLYAPDAVVYHMEAASDPERPKEAGARPWIFYSDTRVYWITRNRWLLMLTYQPGRHTPWLVFGWMRSFFFHALKAGHLRAFLRGVAAGIGASGQALAKRRLLRQAGRDRWEELWRLMRTC